MAPALSGTEAPNNKTVATTNSTFIACNPRSSNFTNTGINP